MYCFFLFGFHYFLFLPRNLPKMTYIEVLKSPQNDIFWSAKFPSEWKYSWRFPQFGAKRQKVFFRKYWLLFPYKKCIEICQFGEIFRFWTTKCYLFMVKTYDSKISPKWHFFVLNLKKFLLLLNPRNLPKTTDFTCSISSRNSQNNSHG